MAIDFSASAVGGCASPNCGGGVCDGRLYGGGLLCGGRQRPAGGYSELAGAGMRNITLIIRGVTHCVSPPYVGGVLPPLLSYARSTETFVVRSALRYAQQKNGRDLPQTVEKLPVGVRGAAVPLTFFRVSRLRGPLILLAKSISYNSGVSGFFNAPIACEGYEAKTFASRLNPPAAEWRLRKAQGKSLSL